MRIHVVGDWWDLPCTEICQFYQSPSASSWSPAGVAGHLLHGNGVLWWEDCSDLEEEIARIRCVWKTHGLSSSSRTIRSPDNHAALLQAKPVQTRGYQTAAAGQNQWCWRDCPQAWDFWAPHQSARTAETAARPRPETARADPDHRRAKRSAGGAGAEAPRSHGKCCRNILRVRAERGVSSETKEGNRSHRLT